LQPDEVDVGSHLAAEVGAAVPRQAVDAGLEAPGAGLVRGVSANWSPGAVWPITPGTTLAPCED